MTETQAPPTAQTQGYRPPARYRIVRAADGSPWDGSRTDSDPLWAEIRSNLTGGELEWMKAARTDDEIRARMAPYVLAWNCQAQVYDADADELRWEALPPPAEAGPDVLTKVDAWTVVWLRTQLITAPQRPGDDALEPSSSSRASADGASSAIEPSTNDAPSPTKSRSSRRSPATSSPTASGST